MDLRARPPGVARPGCRRPQAGPRRGVGGRAAGAEWIHQIALAVKARIGLDVLQDTVAQFPTFSEAVLKGIEALEA